MIHTSKTGRVALYVIPYPELSSEQENRPIKCCMSKVRIIFAGGKQNDRGKEMREPCL